MVRLVHRWWQLSQKKGPGIQCRKYSTFLRTQVPAVARLPITHLFDGFYRTHYIILWFKSPKSRRKHQEDVGYRSPVTSHQSTSWRGGTTCRRQFQVPTAASAALRTRTDARLQLRLASYFAVRRPRTGALRPPLGPVWTRSHPPQA